MNREDAQALEELRRTIYLTALSGGMAHLASCFSCLEIVYTLYCKGVLRQKPQDPFWEDRDRFILSKGHGGLALYAVLARCGYFPAEELERYLQPGCSVGGEPNVRDMPGIEASTGALGHGLSVGVGMAIAQRLDGRPAKTYVLLGDGESEEGSIWEAAMSASAFSLDNLVAILDCNGLQKTRTVEQMIRLENWAEKWKAFGWSVTEVDGHDPHALQECLSAEHRGQPRLVIAHTVKGKGVSIMENNPVWHYRIPNRKERRVFESELKIPGEEG